MRMRLFGLLLAAAICPSSAAAAPVVVMGSGGRTTLARDPYLSTTPLTPAPGTIPMTAAPGTTPVTPAPARRGTRAVAASAHPAPARHPRAARRTVRTELLRLLRTGAISASLYHGYLAAWSAAAGTERRLSGVRATELGAVIQTMQNLAAARLLTPSRLPVLFLILARNRQYWMSGQLLTYGRRVEFTGSQLVWEYYPGQGIQLQVLGTFAKADAMYTAGVAEYPALWQLLGEMVPLAASRGGSLAWEYYFAFDGGTPPWTSAMSQGTAIEALTRGFASLGGTGSQASSYLSEAHQALRVFTRPPPSGVSVPTAAGPRFLQYSFAPGSQQNVLNGFLQSLIGLDDYWHASGDPLAGQLFNAANAEAQAELPLFDTGAWSLYQPGQEDTLDYHQLVIGFLQELCTRTAAPAYCTTAQRFTADLTTPPVLTLLTTRLRRGKPGSVTFGLSKISHVGIVVTRGEQTILATSATFPHGTQSFAVPTQRRADQLGVRLAATDLAGNFSRITGTVQVTR